MNTLTKQDLHFVVSRLPKDVIEIVKKHGIIVAGGFIRETISNGKVSDIDMFGATVETLTLAALQIAQARKARMFSTDNAITVLSPPRFPLQFITRWLFPDKKENCINSFDFTVCQAGVWFADDKWQSAVADNFYPDLAAKRLVYTYPERLEDAGGSMLRVRKFLQRGYSIQSGSLAGVISRLVGKLDLQNKSYGEKEIAKIITGLLREVDPLTVVDGVELVDEHEVNVEQ